MYNFDNVWLVPSYSDINSRHEICLKVDEDFEIPIIASPMDTVVNSEVSSIMRSLGGTAVFHRYDSIENEKLKWENVTHGKEKTFCAIGASGDYKERFWALYEGGCRYFCIDVAHGYHENVKGALKYLLSVDPNLTIMAGNVADIDGFNFLADLGAKYIRVGVAGGSVCETRNKTGFGIPTLESVFRCSKSDRESYIVADGGIRDSGDAVKCLALGADFVMLGSVLSAHNESPGSIIEKDGKKYKVFRGMASQSAQLDWRGRVSVAEGTTKLVELKENSLKETVEIFCNGIRSGLSYSGVRQLRDFQSKVRFESSYQRKE